MLISVDFDEIQENQRNFAKTLDNIYIYIYNCMWDFCNLHKIYTFLFLGGKPNENYH